MNSTLARDPHAQAPPRPAAVPAAAAHPLHHVLAAVSSPDQNAGPELATAKATALLPVSPSAEATSGAAAAPGDVDWSHIRLRALRVRSSLAQWNRQRKRHDDDNDNDAENGAPSSSSSSSSSSSIRHDHAKRDEERAATAAKGAERTQEQEAPRSGKENVRDDASRPVVSARASRLASVPAPATAQAPTPAAAPVTGEPAKDITGNASQFDRAVSVQSADASLSLSGTPAPRGATSDATAAAGTTKPDACSGKHTVTGAVATRSPPIKAPPQQPCKPAFAPILPKPPQHHHHQQHQQHQQPTVYATPGPLRPPALSPPLSADAAVLARPAMAISVSGAGRAHLALLQKNGHHHQSHASSPTALHLFLGAPPPPSADVYAMAAFSPPPTPAHTHAPLAYARGHAPQQHQQQYPALRAKSGPHAAVATPTVQRARRPRSLSSSLDVPQAKLFKPAARAATASAAHTRTSGSPEKKMRVADPATASGGVEIALLKEKILRQARLGGRRGHGAATATSAARKKRHSNGSGAGGVSDARMAVARLRRSGLFALSAPAAATPAVPDSSVRRKTTAARRGKKAAASVSGPVVGGKKGATRGSKAGKTNVAAASKSEGAESSDETCSDGGSSGTVSDSAAPAVAAQSTAPAAGGIKLQVGGARRRKIAVRTTYSGASASPDTSLVAATTAEGSGSSNIELELLLHAHKKGDPVDESRRLEDDHVMFSSVAKKESREDDESEDDDAQESAVLTQPVLPSSQSSASSSPAVSSREGSTDSDGAGPKDKKKGGPVELREAECISNLLSLRTGAWK